MRQLKHCTRAEREHRRGVCGVVNMSNPRDAERSIKGLWEKGHLSWAWEV